MFYCFYLTSWEEDIKCEVSRAFFSLFRTELNKFNNTGAKMLYFIYHMTVKILKNCMFGVKTSRFSLYLRKVIIDVITFPENL